MDAVISRFLRGYGLIERPVIDCARELTSRPVLRPRSHLKLSARTEDCTEAVDYLSTLTFPTTRHVLFPAGERWSATVNNNRNGSDTADYVFHFARGLRVRTVRVVDERPRRGRPARTEARIVTMHAADGEISRSVCCMLDGDRWVHETSGEPFPIEQTFNVDARRKRDRFTRENLRDLLHAAGMPALEGPQFRAAGEYFLLEERYYVPQQVRTYTLEQVDSPAFWQVEAGIGWVDNGPEYAVTHFERALELDPACEPQLRPYLERARRNLARQQVHAVRATSLRDRLGSLFGRRA